MSDAVIDQPKKWLTRDNIKTTFMGLALAGLAATLLDGIVSGNKAEEVCNRYKEDFAVAATQVRSAGDVTINGRKPTVELSVSIDGKEYGSFLPWSRSTCYIVQPHYNR